ncbi:MAG TPA: FAD-dependent oxidoreductase [Candidatus Dormibacteraeota bacterium]|nr:FAD-dependent oxidoreductase [Candidatus Dormibacteraeota bacterium]
MKTDICILGGGIMGLSTACSISKNSDSEVLLVDRYGIGNELCSSNDVNRVFRYSYGSDELYTRMAVESLQLWRQLERESNQELLLQTGLLLLQGEDRNANGFNEASYRTLTKLGLGADELESSELKEKFSQFRAERAFFDPHGGVLLASKALQTLRALAETSGVKFLQAQATKILPDNRLQTKTENLQTIQFRRMMVIVGPWTNDLLGRRMPRITPTRQQIIYFQPRHGLDPFRPERCPVFFTDKHYGLPAAGIDGVKLSPKQLEEPVDPETVNRIVDDNHIEDCRDACRRFVPDIADGAVLKAKVCLYDMTENSDFVIDRDPDQQTIIYGYGFSGHGFKFAPLIGKLLAQLALDEMPSFDMDRFSASNSKRIRPTIGAHLGKGE